MVLVESLDHGISEELIVVVQALPTVPCPLDVLLLSPHLFPVVHQAQYHVHPMLLRLRYHKVQPLNDKNIVK